MKDNLVLIGMLGVGKSTAGVVAAKLAGYQFLDSDLVIMQRDGRLLREIIEQDGVEGFLSIENRVNASISTHNTIIATGGSVIFGDGAMYHLSSIGTHLDESRKVLWKSGSVAQPSQSEYESSKEVPPSLEGKYYDWKNTDVRVISDGRRPRTRRGIP